MTMELWPMNRIINGLTYTCECGFSTVNPSLFEAHYETQFCMGYRKGRDAERERCAKIADEGMPDQNNIQQREIIQVLRPDLSDPEIRKSLNEANRHFEACTEFIAMRIRGDE